MTLNKVENKIYQNNVITMPKSKIKSSKEATLIPITHKYMTAHIHGLVKELQ